MIPAGGFLIGEAPVTSRPPNYSLPQRVTASYREGAVDFVPEERVPPFTVVSRTTGLFTAALVAGSNDISFGFRTELRRDGVYGTILVDRLEFELAAIQLLVEGCPDTTEETQETSVPVTLTSEEACPHVTEETEETSVPISAIASDE